MREGRVVESGASESVLSHPQHEYTRQLISDAPSFQQDTDHRARIEVSAGDGAAISSRPLLEVDHVVQQFGGGAAACTAVSDVSFTVTAGSTHAIVGESGSGKTSLGRMIAGFAHPTSGAIRVAGRDVSQLRRGGLREYRRVTQLVYQNPFGSLNPRLTIGETLAEPVRFSGTRGQREVADHVAQALQQVSLPESFATRKPNELSGGQRQRVSIARALILDPQLVVLDEAVSALDVTVQAQILRLLAELQGSLGVTFVFISHDLAVVRSIADTVTVMVRGVQVEHGVTESVFAAPQHEATRSLIAAIPGQSFRAGQYSI